MFVVVLRCLAFLTHIGMLLIVWRLVNNFWNTETMITRTAVREIPCNTQDIHSVDVASECVTCLQRWFRQSLDTQMLSKEPHCWVLIHGNSCRPTPGLIWRNCDYFHPEEVSFQEASPQPTRHEPSTLKQEWGSFGKPR